MARSDALAVMIVDDDVEMRSMLCDYLEREGLRVIAESSREGAVAAVESASVQAVVVDKEMPGLNGLDLLSFLRHRRPEVPVIVVTAFGGPAVAREAFQRGASRYLEKPFRVADLLAAIHSVAVESADVRSG